MTASADLKSRFRAQAQGAMALDLAYIGVVNGLFSALHRLHAAESAALAAAAAMDAGYVRRWCDAAYAVGFLDDAGDERFCLSESGDALRAEAQGGLMPVAIQAVLAAHMAERAAAFMRNGARPGERVLAERETILPWFGPMLEASFAPLFEDTICPNVAIFREVDARGGLAVDLGCGNGWYLRALARRCPALRGLGIDGFQENIDQATARAADAGLAARLRFTQGDAHALDLAEKADLIAMNRALHHVWEAGIEQFLERLRGNLKPGGAAVIWEPNWPRDRARLRQPGFRRRAFQNRTEHVQGNHLLGAAEIADAFARTGFVAPAVHLFSEGQEAVIVARAPP
jgi:SAM-dependent methyltransferase